MKKIINIIVLAAVLAMAGCKGYDDSELWGKIDDFDGRIKALEQKVEALNGQVSALGYLTAGNVITSVDRNNEGDYVITFKGNDNIEQTVVIATLDQMIDIPVIGVKEDGGVYYWTVVTDGVAEWLGDGQGGKVPVSGHTPVIAVDAGGYWTVDGVRVTRGGQPVKANTESTSLFRNAGLDANGNLGITLADGSVLTLQVFEVLNLTFDVQPVTVIGDPSRDVTVNYSLVGESAPYAIIDIAKADGLTAVMDRENGRITVSFPADFTSGTLIVVAYDLKENTIVKPLFFRSAGPGVITISTAAELVAFAQAVNSGGSEGAANVVLGGDIDMSGVTDWTPIGTGTYTLVSNKLTITGVPFKGVFDGQGYSLKNFNITTTNNTDGGAFGLFGVIDGATIKNLTVGSADAAGSSSLTVSVSAPTECGMIAGLCNESTIENCTNYAALNYNGSSAKRVTVAGIAGFMFTTTSSAQIKNCANYGKITSTTSNTQAGADAVHCAGICGFASNDASSSLANIILDCDNYGEMVSVTARTSGIVAAANRFTNISHCTNYGNQTNSFATQGGGRLGNITCITGAGSSMSYSVNRGDLVSTTAARCGGIVSLPNHATNTFDNCINYGEVITDSEYRGLFFGYNTLACTWINCTADGKLGKYNGGAPQYDDYDQSGKTKYLGMQNASLPAQFSNIIYAVIGETGGGGGGDVPATLKVLFIGNSFTKDAVEHLPGIVGAAGINSLKMVHMYYGGRTIPEYNDGYAAVTDYTCYRCNTNTTVWAGYTGYSIRDIVLEEDWDIVSIQEHTGKRNAWEWTAAEKAAIDGLIAKIKADQTTPPEFVYIMSQAYASPDILPSYGQIGVLKNNFTSQAHMYGTIAAQGQKVLAETAVDKIIPTGTVLQNLRTSSLNNSYDLTRDGYHMDFGISRYAASCAVFESVISPEFGNITLDTNTYRYSVSNTTDGSYTTPVTDANAPVALQAARHALEKPFEVTSMATP